MAIVRSYGNAFEIIDRTQDLLIIPNNWDLLQNLGIFNTQGVATSNIALEKVTESGQVIVDVARGSRSTVNTDYTREMHSFIIPHFPLDDYITPEDVQGKLAYGLPEREETVAAVRARKMERIRRNHAWTLEVARAQLITNGTVYAPNGTVLTQNFYTEFGITRFVQDFNFGSSTQDQISNIEACIASIQDGLLNGGVVSQIVAICSPTFFSRLISHPTVKTAYQYYTSGGQQQPLRERLRANGGRDARYREFDFGGVLFIEYRASLAGYGSLIPAGDAYFLPLDAMDVFETYFGPANKFDFVNTLGEEVYMFEYADPKGQKIEIETETNFINVLRRPAGVVRAWSST